jgi:hypothetical protein
MVIENEGWFFKKLRKYQTGAVSTFLFKNPKYLVKYPFMKRTILEIFHNPTEIAAKRLIALAVKGIFTPEEIRPFVFQCAYCITWLEFNDRFPNIISSEEMLRLIPPSEVAAVVPTMEQLVQEPKKATKKVRYFYNQAMKIKGMRELVTAHEVHDS